MSAYYAPGEFCWSVINNSYNINLNVQVTYFNITVSSTIDILNMAAAAGEVDKDAKHLAKQVVVSSLY